MSQVQRLKYPLTENAKFEAKRLIEAWDDNVLDQYFTLYDHTAGHVRNTQLGFGLGANDDFEPPVLALLLELAEYKLIRLQHVMKKKVNRYEITLLQELRNAVFSDYAVSNFFLTTSAVGTIIYGNLEMQAGATIRSAANNFGNIDQSLKNISSELKTSLGVEFLETHSNVADAIDELETATEETRSQKLGRVILELGRSMEHVANAGAIMMAADWLSKLL